MNGHYILEGPNHDVVDLGPILIDDSTAPDGRRVNLDAMRRWGEFMEDGKNRIVKQEGIGPYWVSTVFLGLDHSFNPDRAPVLFETMTFDTEHKKKIPLLDSEREFTMEADELDGFSRYSSWAEAEEGHKRIADVIRRYLDQISAEVESATHPPTSKAG